MKLTSTSRTGTSLITGIISACLLGLAGTGHGKIEFQDYKILASDGEAFDEFGWSIDIDGEKALFGAFTNDNGTFAGSAYVMRLESGQWVEEAKLLPDDPWHGDYFGYSVSLDGNTALVGAHYDDDNGTKSGSAYVFRFDGSQWVQEAKLVPADGAAEDWFGCAVSISGNTALVGARYDDDNGNASGSAYVFHFDGSQWVQEAKLLDSAGHSGNYFGDELIIEGDTAMIGAPGGDGGAVIVYEFNGTQWNEEAKLLGSDGAAADFFGCSIALEGNSALIGAWGHDNEGAAYVFRFDGGQWVEEAKLVPSDTGHKQFGACVSLDGDTALIGAAKDDEKGLYSGSAYIFRFDGSQWAEETKLLASDGQEDDQLGQCVAIGGGTIMVGAHFDDDMGEDSGSVYVYTKAAGACCTGNDSICVIASEYDCLYFGHTWLGSGTSCEDVSCGTSGCIADINHDDIVDINDLLIVISDWGLCD